MCPFWSLCDVKCKLLLGACSVNANAVKCKYYLIKEFNPMPQLNTKFVTLTPEAHLKLSILKAELGERTFSDVIILATDYYRANSYRCKQDKGEKV